MQHLGVPDWVAQRLWIGTLIFAAATGVLVLGAPARPRRSPAATAAAALYGLSPYLLDYVNRTSILLAPWAALGWMMALHRPRRPARRLAVAGRSSPSSWRRSAASTPPPSVLCGLAPVLWLAHAAWVSREVPVRRALAAAARIGGLTLAASAWWIVALAVQARYGADVLAYSETLSSVAATSLASEVVRGLGYWLFYGGDVVGPLEQRVDALPHQPRPGRPRVRPRRPRRAGPRRRPLARAHCGSRRLVLVGLVVSVGAHPYDDPSPLGTVVRDAVPQHARPGPAVLDPGRCRSCSWPWPWPSARPSPRWPPGRCRRPGAAAAAAVAVVALAAVNLPALWNGTYVDALLRRPSAIPAYWHAGRPTPSSASDDGTRALELPGAEFAAYRWGTTNDADPPRADRLGPR